MPVPLSINNEFLEKEGQYESHVNWYLLHGYNSLFRDHFLEEKKKEKKIFVRFGAEGAMPKGCLGFLSCQRGKEKIQMFNTEQKDMQCCAIGSNLSVALLG